MLQLEKIDASWRVGIQVMAEIYQIVLDGFECQLNGL